MRCVDAILLAETILKDYQNKQDLTCPIILHNNGILKSISQNVISGKTFEIKITCIPWTAKNIQGWLRRYKEHAEILYSHDLNTCWSRLVICKEASHILIDRSDSFTKNPVSLVNNLINNVPFGIADDIDSETLALVCAIDLLVPWQLRDELYQMEKNGTSFIDIANEFRVPEKIISLRLSPSYKSLLKEAHSN